MYIHIYIYIYMCVFAYECVYVKKGSDVRRFTHMYAFAPATLASRRSWPAQVRQKATYDQMIQATYPQSVFAHIFIYLDAFLILLCKTSQPLGATWHASLRKGHVAHVQTNSKRQESAARQSHSIGKIHHLFSDARHSRTDRSGCVGVSDAQAAIPVGSKLSFQPLPTAAGSKNLITGRPTHEPELTSSRPAAPHGHSTHPIGPYTAMALTLPGPENSLHPRCMLVWKLKTSVPIRGSYNHI